MLSTPSVSNGLESSSVNSTEDKELAVSSSTSGSEETASSEATESRDTETNSNSQSTAHDDSQSELSITEDVSDDFEAYLRKHLPKESYGGLYLRTYHDPLSTKLHLWVVDRDVVDSVINGFDQDRLEVIYQPTQCSVAALESLRDAILSMNEVEDRIYGVVLQDIDNRLEVHMRDLTADDYYFALTTIISRSGISDYVDILEPSDNVNMR